MADTLYRYVLEIQPYSNAAAATTTYYFSDIPWTTEPFDTPFNRFIPARLSAFQFSNSLYQGSLINVPSAPGSAVAVLANTDGSLDELESDDLSWGQRVVRLLRGTTDLLYTEMTQVFIGVVSNVQFPGDTIVFQISDNSYRMQRALRAKATAGNAVGRPLPFIAGLAYHCPVEPYSNGLDYLCGHRPLTGVVAAYDKGAVMTLTTDYTVNLTTPTISLVSAADGRVTADLRRVSYTDERSSRVLKQIVVEDAGFSDPGELDTDAFTTYDSYNVSTGIWVPSSRDVPISVALDQLCGSFCWWWYCRPDDGKFTFGQLTTPAGVPDFEVDEGQWLNLSKLASSPPVWEVNYYMRQYWDAFGAADVVATGDTRDQLLLNHRYGARAEDAAVKTRYSDYRSLIVDYGCMSDSSGNADAMATYMLGLFKVLRRTIQITVGHLQWQVRLHNEVRLNTARYGFPGYKDFRVIGISEDIFAKTTTLTLWG